jgi:ATP-dependent Lon protease
MLREQLNVIRRELGLTKDDKDAVADKIRERLKGLQLSEAVQKVIDEELNRLQFLESNSSEFRCKYIYLYIYICMWVGG